jgi:hypothetical protein
MVGFPFFILMRAASSMRPNQSVIIIAYVTGKDGKLKLSLYITTW